MCRTMTLEDWAKANSWPSLFTGTEIPEPTIDLLFKFFKRRVIGSDEDEIEAFEDFFTRKIEEIERQYMKQLRNDMTDFDPTVTVYLERWTRGSERGATYQGEAGAESLKRAGSITSKKTGEDVENTEDESHAVNDIDTRRTEIGYDKESGTDSVEKSMKHTDNLHEHQGGTETRTDDLETERDTSQTRTDDLEESLEIDLTRTDDLTDTDTRAVTRTDDLTQTRDLTDLRTDNLQADTESASHSKSKQGVKSLTGTTPMSSWEMPTEQPVEPNADDLTGSLKFAGFPSQLDWSFMDSQTEAVTNGAADMNATAQVKNTGTVETKGTGTLKNTGTQKSANAGDLKHTGTQKQAGTNTRKNSGTQSVEDKGSIYNRGTVEHEKNLDLEKTGYFEENGTDATTYGKKTDRDMTIHDSGLNKDDVNASGSRTMKYDSQNVQELDTTDSRQHSKDINASSDKKSDVRELESGRSGAAAPELLQKCNTYLKRANSFKWLRQQLDECFNQVLCAY